MNDRGEIIFASPIDLLNSDLFLWRNGHLWQLTKNVWVKTARINNKGHILWVHHCGAVVSVCFWDGKKLTKEYLSCPEALALSDTDWKCVFCPEIFEPKITVISPSGRHWHFKVEGVKLPIIILNDGRVVFAQVHELPARSQLHTPGPPPLASSPGRRAPGLSF